MSEEYRKLKEKCDAYENALHWISIKENTYPKPRECILAVSRATLNVFGGYEYRIPEGYQHIVDEALEERSANGDS